MVSWWDQPVFFPHFCHVILDIIKRFIFQFILFWFEASGGKFLDRAINTHIISVSPLFFSGLVQYGIIFLCIHVVYVSVLFWYNKGEFTHISMYNITPVSMVSTMLEYNWSVKNILLLLYHYHLNCYFYT